MVHGCASSPYDGTKGARRRQSLAKQEGVIPEVEMGNRPSQSMEMNDKFGHLTAGRLVDSNKALEWTDSELV